MAGENQTVVPATQQQLNQQQLSPAAPVKPTGPVPTTINVARAPNGQFATAEEQAQADAQAASQVAGGADGGAGAPADGNQQQPELPKFKIKVNGEEQEIDYETARRELEIGYGAKRKFSELGQRQQQLEHLAAQLSEDPAVAMEALGLDPEQWAVQFLNQRTAMMSMSPEEQQLYQQQLQLQQREAQIAKQEQQWAQRQAEAQQAADLALINQHLPTLLEQRGLPREPEIIEEVAMYLEEARQAGVGITPDSIARAVHLTEQREVQRAIRFIRSRKGKHLMDLLGEEGRQEFRKLELEAYRANKGRPNGQQVSYQQPQQQQPKKMLTESEYLALQKARGL